MSDLAVAPEKHSETCECCNAWGRVYKQSRAETITAEAQLRTAKQERDAAMLSLQEVMDLIGQGALVRNVTNDGSSDWAIRMLPLVSTLGRAQKLLQERK